MMTGRIPESFLFRVILNKYLCVERVDSERGRKKTGLDNSACEVEDTPHYESNSWEMLKGMRFGQKLQGKASHEALVALQDAEIRLLENIKKCLTLRIKIDQQYSNGLGELVAVANRLDTSEFKTPVFQSWSTIVQETEVQQKLIQDNANHLLTHTLDRLLHLIDEKKATRKFYIEERQRLEVEFAKLQEETQKHKCDYEKNTEKYSHEKLKYEEMSAKGKPGSKLEDSKNRFIKQGTKLHKVHNDYVISLHDVTLHQLHYLSTTLPGLLNYHQDVQEATVKQCKDILEEYTTLTNLSSENFEACHGRIQQSITSLNPASEYTEFLDKNKSEPLESAKFAFDRTLLEEYRGKLKADVVEVNDLTIEHLKTSRAAFMDKMTTCRNKKETKETELQTLEENIAKKPPDNELSESDKISYETQSRAVQVLKKDIVELNCMIDKYQNMYNLLNDPLTRLGDDPPPEGLEFSTSPQDGEDRSLPSPSTLSNASSTGTFPRKSHLQLIRKKIPFLKPPSTPPKPPSKETLDKSPDALQEDSDLGERSPVVTRQNSMTAVDTTNANTGVNRGSNMSDGYHQDSSEEEIDEMTLQPNSQLEDMEWFHGVLPREEVQRLLAKDGDFLVRESKNKKTGQPQYVLSVMWSGHKHFIIQGQEGEWRFEGNHYPTIPELVVNQLRSNLAVTKKSQAVISRPIVREDWELNNDDIELGEKIDNGHFGEVFRGSYKVTKQEVAIKICRETLSEDAKKKFLQEGRILKQYDHPNIVKFIGIAAQRQPVMIVMEFVPGGSLLKFLQNKGQQQTAKELMKMCEDAAAGMAYLEELGCIHRDLAARNCLVGKNKIIKISDFGMSREEEVYKVSDGLKQIPIKWTAPEALNLGEYTSMCDVWSYGVLMWEVFSFGDPPYNGLTNNQAREKIETGYRMPAPQGTPEMVYALMLRCWDAKPQNRPHFAEIKKELNRLRTVL